MVLKFENNLNISTNIFQNLNIYSNTHMKRNLNVSGNLICGDNIAVKSYINFGKVLDKSNGYGIRENSGNIQIKNYGGEWSNISTTLWSVSGTKVYYNTNYIGLGTSEPLSTLDIRGNIAVSGNAIIDTLSLVGGLITDTSGNISFGNMNLVTTGNMNITSNLNVSNYSNFSGNVSIAKIGNLKNQSLTINHPTGSQNNSSFIDLQYNGIQIGSIEQDTTSSVIYNTTSDYRLKENLTKIDKPLERLLKLKSYNYNYKTDPDKLQEGLIAHEVMEIVPFAVSGEKDEMEYKCSNCNKNECECYWYEDGKMELKPKYQKIAYSNLVPLLIGSIQELNEKLDNALNK
jgi:hypothetical protein